jgi:glycosyltransferase involved in cell wall biosynthesis
MNKVSVIIPNYNRAAIIGETIENMLSQTLKPHEVIVVDDGSSDDSVKVITSFGDKVILVQQINKGPGAARNAGIKIATGNLIQFMDSDDLASLNKLEVQAKALIDNNADIVYGPWLKAWMDNKEMRLENVVLQKKALPDSRTPLLWFLTNWSMIFQQCLVKKSVFNKIGFYREDIRYFEDGDLFVRILLGNGKLVFESESLTFYRLNDFGKLTGEGLINKGRALAYATFYQDVIKAATKNDLLTNYINHPEFKRNTLKALIDLQQAGLNDLEQYTELAQVAGGNERFSKMALLIKKVQAGINQRIKGHRWPKSYQAGQLSQKQEKLITQLGYNLIN